ncbi:MAG: twin-arginine translocase subunit TatC [Verrucomicrobia bacterium]|nr:twin-arginine translocase subunit TatC [Cytophagales bacterium]
MLDQLQDNEEIDAEVPGSEKEMSFIDHLEELRWHIVRSVASILVFSLLSFIFMDFIFNTLILGPKKPDFWTYRMLCRLADYVHYKDLCVEKLDFILISRDLQTQFTTSITLAFVIGVVCAFPYTFWEIWRFVKPGLHYTEKRATNGATFFVSLLFALGILFGYYVVTPLVINFLANYKLDPSIANQIDVGSYMATIATLTLACGIMFQLPMVALVLSKAGVITPQFLKTYRRHAFVVILIVAALITPSPDVMSQIIVALPLVLLYEVSILVSANVWRKRRKEELANG